MPVVLVTKPCFSTRTPVVVTFDVMVNDSATLPTIAVKVDDSFTSSRP